LRSQLFVALLKQKWALNIQARGSLNKKAEQESKTTTPGSALNHLNSSWVKLPEFKEKGKFNYWQKNATEWANG